MKDPKRGIEIKDKKFHLRTYKDCFTGKEMIDWLLLRKVAFDRQEAVEVGEKMISNRQIQPAVTGQKREFKDGGLLYRFSNADDALTDDKEDNSSKFKLKVCVLGGERSGKTALCVRYSNGSFVDEQKPTGAEEIYRKEGVTFQDETTSAEVLDTGTNLANNFQQKLTKWNDWANGFMLVYSTTSKASFEEIPKLFTTLIKVRQLRMTPIVLVGTRADLEDERKVSKEDGLNVANRYRCKLVEVSSKNGENVAEAFNTLYESIKQVQFMTGPVQHKSGWLKMKKAGEQPKRRYIIITDSGLRYYSDPPESMSDTSKLKGVIPLQNCQVDLTLVLERRYSESDTSMPPLNALNTSLEMRRSSDLDRGAKTPPLTPKKTITRLGSFQSIHKEKLKIYILDNTDTQYQLLTTSEEERYEWYSHLSKVVDKANFQAQKKGDLGTDSKSLADLSPEDVLSQGIQMFNKTPKKGIEFLAKADRLQQTPEGIVAFLTEHAKVMKRTAVGQFLGMSSNAEVLKLYLDKLEFKNLPFDEAIRLFLSKFTLPGEAQMIDRIMEKFAARYCHCNPSAFTNPDVGYILAFSLIMLNTDAHNPSIKVENKMTKAQFISNNRGINNGSDLPPEYLEQLYDNIVRKEIQMVYERDDFAQWDKQGWIYFRESKTKDAMASLTKNNKKNIGKKLWCIISACCLYIFDGPQDKTPMHIIPLDNVQIDSLFEANETDPSAPSGFVLFNTDPKGTVKSAVEGKEVHFKELLFFCENRKAKMEWMLTFKLNLVSAPSYK
eukprot:TRINITY_DN3466_c0_g1_i1.p1 TRINITY_DN3466_c0_g1~~TRINITY_DN3466_c0_g1_i1.p1  ORF type:complete len:862 (+),score=271.54 TRINITY_DN3466_c0_g1_i1:255-2588(+)